MNFGLMEGFFILHLFGNGELLVGAVREPPVQFLFVSFSYLVLLEDWQNVR